MPDAAYIEVQVGGHRANSRHGIALVDHADADAIGAYRWSLNHGYAVRGIYGGGKPLWVRMHRDLLGLVPGDGIHVDHINGNRLDNRRANLRVCTQAQNNQNLHQRPHRGTTWNVQKSCWRAEAQLAGRQHFLGYFATQEDAAAVAAAFRRSHMPYSSDARETRAG